MQTIPTTTLPAPWALVAINPGEESPMLNHRGGEVAVDTEKHTFYCWNIFAATYGTESIEASCQKYLRSRCSHTRSIGDRTRWEIPV